MAKFSWTTLAGGFLLGTVGLELLKTDTADVVYKYATAGVLIAKDWVMEQVEYLNARAQDIYADAKEIHENYQRMKAEENFEETVRGTDE